VIPIYKIVADEILEVEYVQTAVQVAEVGTHFDWAIHVRASYHDGMLLTEYRRPVIEGSEFQGQIVTDEQRPMFLRVDDSEPLEIPVTNGIAEVPLEFESPGVYQLRITADFPCESAELEVVV
jgi:hypothetical protein